MSDEEEIDKSKFNIGIVGDKDDPDMLLIAFPIKTLAQKGPDGLDEAYGKCRRLEAVVTNAIRNHWSRKKVNGIQKGMIGADGRPMVIQ